MNAIAYARAKDALELARGLLKAARDNGAPAETFKALTAQKAKAERDLARVQKEFTP